MMMDYAEPDIRANERSHDWQHQYSIYVKHSTGQIHYDQDAADMETKIRVLRCIRCGQVWRHP